MGGLVCPPTASGILDAVPAPARMTEQSSVALSVRLACYSRRDGRRWAAVCPVLDVASQGATEKAARAALQEAVELWFESCLERETLDAALREVGFRVRAQSEAVSPRAERVTVHRNTLRGKASHLGAAASAASRHRFEIHSEVPAFVAAQLLRAESSAATP